MVRVEKPPTSKTIKCDECGRPAAWLFECFGSGLLPGVCDGKVRCRRCHFSHVESQHFARGIVR